MKDECEDSQLLKEFVQMQSDAAFAQLVQKHVDLVYSVALRLLRGDSSLARDGTQAVFCELARNARKLVAHRSLAGWLYTTTRFVCSRMNRSEMRRIVRETAYAMKTSEETAGDVSWNDVEEILDDAMQDLPERDREAVLLRYFRNESFSSIGVALGATENAARMRVERALEKLRAALNRRGVTCPASVLGALLIANAIGTAPAGLAATLTVPAIASVAAVAVAPKVWTLIEFMTATNIKTAVAVIAIAGTTTGWVVSHRKAAHLEQGLVQMQQRAPVSIAAAVPAGSELVDEEELRRLRTQHSELMRLRGEVTQLRRQLTERPVVAPAAAAKSVAPPQDPGEAEREQLKQVSIARMTVARDWAIAFYKFADTKGGLMPAEFEQAQLGYPEKRRPELLEALGKPSVGGADGDGFEIVFHGRLEDIANPAKAIIMRDKEPFHFSPEGAASRTYLFADGHSEVYKAVDGDFTRYELERQPLLRSEESAGEVVSR